MIFNQRVKIRFVQDFEVPPSIVFGFFSNHESLSKIYPGAFKRVVNSIDPRNANGIGSVRRITNFPLVFEETITQYNEPSCAPRPQITPIATRKNKNDDEMLHGHEYWTNALPPFGKWKM